MSDRPTTGELVVMSEDELFAAALQGHLGYQPRLIAIGFKKMLAALVSPASATEQLMKIEEVDSWTQTVATTT